MQVGVAVRLAIGQRQHIGGMVRVGDVLPDAGIKDGRKAVHLRPADIRSE